MSQTQKSRPGATPGAAENRSDQTTTSITRTDDRRALKLARRTLGAALAQGDVHPDLAAAAVLVIEAGRPQ